MRPRGAGPGNLARRLARVQGLALTYPEAGATRGAVERGVESLPRGYRHVRRSRAVGRGDVAFYRVSGQVRRWGLQRGIGLVVAATSEEVVEGAEVMLGLPIGPVWLTGGARVVWVLDEPDRFGFAYGTLPGHPETGEESFLVERDAAGTVRLTVTAFVRSGARLTSLGGPVSWWVQARATRRYLEAVE